MNEAAWNASTDPAAMGLFVARRSSERQRRLFACACCRRVWHLLPAETRRAVEAAEGFADGVVLLDELRETSASVYLVARQAGGAAEFAGYAAMYCSLLTMKWPHAAEAAGQAARAMARSQTRDGALIDRVYAGGQVSGGEIRRLDRAYLQEDKYLAVERAVQAALLRCLFQPFRRGRPTRGRQPWGATAEKLAQTIYTERAFDRLPILADALEDAGCTDAAILEHCRQPGDHVRGCWVVDLLTERK